MNEDIKRLYDRTRFGDSNNFDIYNLPEYEKMKINKDKDVRLKMYPHGAGTMSIFNKLMNYLFHYKCIVGINFNNLYDNILNVYDLSHTENTIDIDMNSYISYELTGVWANLLHVTDYSWRNVYHNLFTQYIRFSDDFLKRFEPYQQSVDNIKQTKKIISILIRHPALSHEQINCIMPSFEKYDIVIEQLLEQYNHECAFILCTDIYEAEEYFKKKYSSYEIIHPYSMKSSMYSHHEAHNVCENKEEVARISFLTVLLLSKGNDFLFPNSNMATVVLYINPNITPHFLIGK